MKKLLLGFVSFFVVGLYGSPVENPAAPAIVCEGALISNNYGANFRLGYQGDFVLDGRLEQQDGSRIDTDTQDTNSGTVTLNFRERLDLFVNLGSSYTSIDWRFTDPIDQVFRTEMKTQTNFLWTAGARAILYEWGPACLGIGGSYSFCDYAPQKIKQNGISFSTVGTEALWRQWQANLGLSYRIDLFTPYVGVKYSQAELNLNSFPVPIGANNEFNNHFKNKDLVGFYLGCTVSSGQYFMINLEGRLIDEEAITVSADIRF